MKLLLKTEKMEKDFPNNHVYNILRQFDRWASFRFTYGLLLVINTLYMVVSQVAERLKTCYLSKLRKRTGKS